MAKTTPVHTTPVHADRLFDNPDVLQLEFNPWNKSSWYCASDICAVIGCAWKGEPQTLKKIPEHHKAQLAHDGEQGYRNVWCLSISGVIALHRQMTGGDPVGLDAWMAAQVDSITGIEKEKEQPAPLYTALLADAGKHTTPYRLLLLLDSLLPIQIEEIEAFRTGARKRSPTFTTTRDVLGLIKSMNDGDRAQCVAYIEWLLEHPFKFDEVEESTEARAVD